MLRVLIVVGFLSFVCFSTGFAGDERGKAIDIKRRLLEEDLRVLMRDKGSSHPEVIALKERLALLKPEAAQGEPIVPKGLLLVMSKQKVNATLKDARIRSVGGRSFVVGVEVESTFTKAYFPGMQVWIPLDDVIQMVEMKKAQAENPAVPDGFNQESRPTDKALKKKPAHSKLFREFENKSFTTACETHFDRLKGGGAVGDYSFNGSSDVYRTYNAKGKIPADKLKQLLAALKTDLHKRAKASGVEKVGEPSDKIGDRPISLLGAMYLRRSVIPHTLQGFYLTYTDGNVTGAIDVLAGADSDADHWTVVCTVHEKLPN